MQTYISNKLSMKKCLMLFVVFCAWSPVWAIGDLKGSAVEESLKVGNTPFTGDFAEMSKERIIRILIPYNRSFFFFDGAQAKGLAYEKAMLFEKFVNKKLKMKTLKIRVLVIPTPRAKLFSQLQDGYGDIAIGNLTITDERRKLVDFSDPFDENVSEILVTHKNTPAISRLLDLSGMEIYARKSSSYYESLKRLNKVLSVAAKKPVDIEEVDDHLEDSDLLEMLNAELIPAIIIDDHKGKFWKQVFKNIKLHPEIAVNSGGQIAWAIRKNNPKLKAVINEFAAKHRAGSLMGNILTNRYLKSAKYITNSNQGAEIKKFQKTVDYFKTYGDIYDFDHLMLAALAYQESHLDQSLKSKAGAIGVMQILPSTAKDKNVGISNIEKLGPNIHAGTKYLRFMADRYFPEDNGMSDLDRIFFTFASYNAGPARVVSLRQEAKKMGFDPNLWFNNVEVVAAKRIGRETVQYVSNILKYYVAYKILEEKFVAQVKD